MPYGQLGVGGVEVTVAVEDAIAGKIRKGIGKLRPQPKRMAAATKDTGRRSEVDERIAGLEWYHTIEVQEGVVTPGVFDHRPYLSHYPIPESLAGKRVLDVATYDVCLRLKWNREVPPK